MTTTVTPATSTTSAAPATPASPSPTSPLVRHRASIATLALGFGAGAVLALAGNVAVFVVGNLGAPLQVPTGGDPKLADLDLASVIVASVAWLAIGAVGLWVCQRLFARGFAIWAVGAAAVTAASLVPLVALDVDAGSKVALAVMHVVVAVAAVAGQAVADRRSAR